MTGTQATTTKTNHYYLRMLAALVALAEQARPTEAAFLGANGKIAFASYRDGNSEIYKMNADSSNQKCSVLPPCSPGPATR